MRPANKSQELRQRYCRRFIGPAATQSLQLSHCNSVRGPDIRINAARSRMVEDRLRHPAVAVKQRSNRRTLVVHAAETPRPVDWAVMGRSMITGAVDGRVLGRGR